MTGFARRLWRIGAGTFAAVVILLAVLLGLFRLALTQVPERREQIEAWAASAIGLPVELGDVDARLGWRGPELGFADARILSADAGSVLIEAQEGAITLDPLALVTGRIQPGLILLSGVDVSLVRSQDGEWQLLGAGGPALGGGAGLPQVGELPVSEVRLTDLDVRFEDRQRGLGPWEFTVSAITLLADEEGASLEASVGLPAVLGRGVRVEARMTGQDQDGLPLGWSAEVDAQGLDMAMGRDLFREADWFPAGGTVDLRLRFAGSRLRPERLVGRMEAEDLASPAAWQPDPYDRVAVRFDWSGGETGWQLRLSDLDVRRAGRRWGSPTARVEMSGRAGDRVLYADADFLRLEDVVPAAAFLPDDLAARLAGLDPRGGLRSLVLRSAPGDGDGAETGWSVRAVLERVGLDASRPFPGVTNLDGRFEGSLDAGRFVARSREFALLVPWLFRDPLRFADFGATVAWRRDERGLTLEARDLAAANADLSVEGQARLFVPPGDRPVAMEINARATDLDVSSASRYLPVGIMPDGVVAWLDRAIVEGRVPEAILEIRGPSRGFPYRQDQGIFRVSFPLDDLVLDFAEGWPRAEGVRADVLFENEAFFADVSTGRLAGDLVAGPVAVEIPDLARGRLSIEGQARGPVAQAREWVLATDMLRRILEPGLGPASVRAGRLEADVDLLLPLAELENNDVRVELDLSGVAVDFSFLRGPVERLGGRVSIHGATVTGEGLAGEVTGRPVTMGLGPVASGATRLSLSGRAGVETVDAVLGTDFAGRASGEAAYDGYLDFPGPETSAPFNLVFASDLVGVAVDMPAPLGKPAGDSMPAELAVAFPETGVQDWRVSLAPGLIAGFRLETGPEGARLGRVVDLPEGVPAPERDGLVLGGRVDRLSLAEWVASDRLPGEALPAMATGFAGGVVAVGTLELPTGAYRDVSLEIARDDDVWAVGADSGNLRGRIRIPADLYSGGRIEADMQRLDIFPAPEEGVEPVPEEVDEDAARAGKPPADEGPWSVPPATVPPALIMVEDFRIGGIRLGAGLLDVVSVPGGFEIARFDGGGKTFRFMGHGRAVASETEDLSEFHLELSSSDLAATLDSAGYAPAMTGESGRFAIDLAWPGGLRSDMLTVMEGSASLEFKDGRLTTVGTGAGRIFGLLSLQALPRRLTLDFSDVFSGGLPYDEIKGDFEIAGGDAYTTNLVLRGPTVDMGVVGRIGLASRDYDQTAVVSADLGAAVPVAGAIAGGPIVGAALWVLSEALKNPLRTQLTYRITGPWEEPQVERVASGTRPPTEQADPGEKGR